MLRRLRVSRSVDDHVVRFALTLAENVRILESRIGECFALGGEDSVVLLSLGLECEYFYA